MRRTDDAYLAGHLHPISARITDTVQKVLIDDNQHVVEGQTLVILDPNDYKVSLDQAQAALDAAGRQVQTAAAAINTTSQSATAQTTQAQGAIGEANASIQASKAAVTAAEAGVPRADAQLQEANATLQREETDLRRYEDLYAKEQVSKQTLDHQRASYQVAVAGQAAAQEQVRQAQAQLIAAQQGVTRAEAQLTSSEGGLQSAQARSWKQECGKANLRPHKPRWRRQKLPWRMQSCSFPTQHQSSRERSDRQEIGGSWSTCADRPATNGRC